MKTKISNVRTFAVGVTALLSIASSAAIAAPPANIANTAWTLLANRSTTQLYITSQGGAGAAGASVCRTIRGNLTDVVDVPSHGWYCPSTGRIRFKHNNLHTGVTVRVFTGNLSDAVPGEPLYMSGTVAVDDAVFGSLGEYSFSAMQ